MGSGPSEPMNIDSERNYLSSNFSTIYDSIGEDDTLYIRQLERIEIVM